jgi:hypothetical protein
VTIFYSTSADFHFPLPRLLALPTEAWRGAEICICLVKNVYVILPGPLFSHLTQNSRQGCNGMNKHSSLFSPSVKDVEQNMFYYIDVKLGTIEFCNFSLVETFSSVKLRHSETVQRQ